MLKPWIKLANIHFVDLNSQSAELKTLSDFEGTYMKRLSCWKVHFDGGEVNPFSGKF